MDITLQLKDVLKDASKVTIEDVSTYTTPARSDLYSVFYAYKLDELENKTTLITEVQGDQNAASEWVVVTPTDGYHRFQLILYTVWTATAFVIGNLVERNGVIYIALTNNSTDPEVTVGTDWAIHVGSSDDSSVANVESGLLNCILFYRLKTCFAKEVASVANTACLCDVDKKPLNIQKYERLGVLIDGIAVDNYQTRYTQGEKKVQYMSKLCPNCS